MATERLEDELPPHYTEFRSQLPPTYQVGKEKVSPLVNVTELQAHLHLLSAFAKLKSDVLTAESSDAEDAVHKGRAWVVFVNRAVYRFDRFMSGGWADWPAWTEACIPPLDVIMVWHTYLLNPRAYHEDSIRRTTPFARRLLAMESMPLTLIASLIDPTTFDPMIPSVQREAFFESTSGLSFMYSFTTSTSDVLSLKCPRCNATNETVKWITCKRDVTGRGMGFAEPNFGHNCEACRRVFTRSTLGIRKFVEEVTRWRAGRTVYLPETLLHPTTGRPDEIVADAMTRQLLRKLVDIFKLNTPISANDITTEAIKLGDGLDWDPQKLTKFLHQGLRPKRTYNATDSPVPRIQRILSAYSIAGYASIDLVAAVLRQGSFIEKMNSLGWLEERRFHSVHSQPTLRRAITRYHAFLDLMSEKPKSLYVPTLDIDLVWHTHQLSATAYRSETLRLLHRTPNHDDTVQPRNLQLAYDATANAWQARFGVPYSLCGCMPTLAPDPSNNARRAEAFKFLRRLAPTTLTLSPPSFAQSEREDSLVTRDLTDADASHPSDHNLFIERPDRTSTPCELVLRELASKKRAQAIRRSLELVNSRVTAETSTSGGSHRSHTNEWSILQAERKEARHDHIEAFTQMEGINAEYYPHWAIAAHMPEGFFGAVKYENVTSGCGSGCASCGSGFSLPI